MANKVFFSSECSQVLKKINFSQLYPQIYCEPSIKVNLWSIKVHANIRCFGSPAKKTVYIFVVNQYISLLRDNAVIADKQTSRKKSGEKK